MKTIIAGILIFFNMVSCAYFYSQEYKKNNLAFCGITFNEKNDDGDSDVSYTSQEDLKKNLLESKNRGLLKEIIINDTIEHQIFVQTTDKTKCNYKISYLLQLNMEYKLEPDLKSIFKPS